MSRRRRVLGVWGAAACFAAGLVTACVDLGGLASSGDVPRPEGGPAADGGIDGSSLDGDVDASGSDRDSAVRDDATARVDAASCTTCDCDRDSYLNAEAGCSALEGGLDCDDSDPLVHPGQSFVQVAWSSPHLPVGDWDCDGNVVKQYRVKLTCLAGSICTGEGFVADTPCGASADYFRCAAVGALNCMAVKLGVRTQGCK